MTFKEKATALFWIFLFAVVLLQLSASPVIPIAAAVTFAACLVVTFWGYVRIISQSGVKQFLANAPIALWLIAIVVLSSAVAIVLLLEAYVIMKLTMATPVMDSVAEESVANLFGFLMLSVLITVLNYAFEKYKDYLGQEKELEVLKRKALEMEISLLRNQLSPHFTFNILNNLQVLIRKDKNEALHLLERYSNILRYYVYESQKEKIGIEQEVAFLKEYFDLEVSRHVAGLEVSCSWNLEESDFRIVPFVLSTFVENAFKHTLPNHANEYFIRQSCHVNEAGGLVFEIVNTFDENEVSDKPKGVGLEHVQGRLALAYPGRYSLIRSAENGRYSVRLELKLDR
jgi:two-component system, LytTR family, sensor kinase